LPERVVGKEQWREVRRETTPYRSFSAEKFTGSVQRA
jgi:hypothetical protein